MEIKITDTEGLMSNEKPAMVVLQISREEVDAKNIAHPLDNLMVLTDNKDKFLLYKESLVIMFDGYDDDPRELAEIKEVREYVKSLVSAWPYFPWFALRNSGYAALILSFLCKCEFFKQKNGEMGLYLKNKKEVKDKISDMIERSLPLISDYRIPVDEFINSLESFAAEVGIGSMVK